MTSFRIVLSLLTMCGCFRPATWTSSFKKFLYFVYTVIVYVLMQSSILSNLVGILFNVRSQKDFGEIGINMASIVGSISKITMILFNRKNIVTLINILRREPFLPMDEKEMDIKNRFDKLIDMNSIVLMGAIQITLIVGWFSTLIMEGKNRELPFHTWFPYNYSSLTLYTVTFLYQFVCGTLEVTIHVACDTLFSGLLICVYGQLEMLGHRLEKITDDQGKLVNKCARHHHQLYEYVANVNKTFQVVLFIQMIVSVSMVCFSIFQMSQTRSVSKIFENLMYMFCPMLEIFFYCWYGNEIKQKSLEVSDMIFASNWISFDKNTKRTLLTIMLRSTLPMEVKSGHIISMNVETLMGVMKTSYSAYNVLTRG